MSEDLRIIGIPLKRHTLIAIGTVIGLAFGAGAQVALSKATIASHEQRLGVVEVAAASAATAVLNLAAKTAEHDAKRDQQLDDLSVTTHHIEYLLDHGKR